MPVKVTWQQLLSLCWEFQLAAALPVLAEEKKSLVDIPKKETYLGSWRGCVAKTKRMFPEPAEGMIQT